MKRVLALLLVAALAAGCTGPGGTPTIPGLGHAATDMTAKEAAGKALPRAQQWQADAALVGLATAETRDPQGSFARNHTEEVPFALAADATVGDGRAPQWFLEYHSRAANRSLGLGVYANGTVLVADDRGRSSRSDGHEDSDVVDLARWIVDSPEALTLAMQDANFSASARAHDGNSFNALAPRGFPDFTGSGSGGTGASDPMWVLVAGRDSDRDGHNSTAIFINARTGERMALPFSGGFPGMGGPDGPGGPGDFGAGFGPSSDTFSGSLHPAHPSQNHSFAASASQGLVQAELSWTGGAPTDRALLELRDARGALLQAVDENPGASSFSGTYTLRGAGNYQATVRLAGSGSAPGVSASYVLDLTVR